jgi:hypothetical protein
VQEYCDMAATTVFLAQESSRIFSGNIAARNLSLAVDYRSMQLRVATLTLCMSGGCGFFGVCGWSKHEMVCCMDRRASTLWFRRG